MEYTVKKLSQLAGISVRTLHYYDEIGLLKPSGIRDNGYRYYVDKELVKLQQILFFRELAFPLSEIKEMLQTPDFDTIQALQDQKKLLRMKKDRLEGLLNTLDKTLNSMKGGGKMKNDDMFGSFTKDQLEEYKEEARRRWGHTRAYKQSVERTKNWTKEDYKRVEKEGMEITQALAQVMDKGVESPEVQEQIHRHYQHISQFYDLGYDMYRNLGEMYVADPRFTIYYDQVKPGLAIFMRDAISYFFRPSFRRS